MFTGGSYTPSPPKAPSTAGTTVLPAAPQPPRLCSHEKRSAYNLSQEWEKAQLPLGRASWGSGKGHREGKAPTRGVSAAAALTSNWPHPEGLPGTRCRHGPQGPAADREGPGEGHQVPSIIPPPPGITEDKDAQKETQTLQLEAPNESGLK